MSSTPLKNVTPGSESQVADTSTEISLGLDRLANLILETHAEAKKHAELAIIFALRCGMLCIKAKAKLPHGQFLSWIKNNIHGLTDRTCRKHMEFAKNYKLERDSDLSEEELTSADFTTKLADREYLSDLAARAGQFTQGRSLTELYEDYGVIKINKQERFGNNNPEGKNGAELSTQQKYELCVKRAQKEFNEAFGAISSLLRDSHHQLLGDAHIEQLIGIADEFSKTAKAWLRTPRTQRRELPEDQWV